MKVYDFELVEKVTHSPDGSRTYHFPSDTRGAVDFYHYIYRWLDGDI